jgi:hypothetical protein
LKVVVLFVVEKVVAVEGVVNTVVDEYIDDDAEKVEVDEKIELLEWAFG